MKDCGILGCDTVYWGVSEEIPVSILQVCSEPSWKSRRLYTHRGEETTDDLWEWPIRIRNG